MKYIVRLYFSGFCTYEVEANDAEEAITKAREMPVDTDEVMSNLESWEDCDEAEVNSSIS